MRNHPDPDETHRWPTQDQENGNYSIHCLACDITTVGPKRAQTCYPCHQKGQARWAALSDEEKAREIACVTVNLMAIQKTVHTQPGGDR